MERNSHRFHCLDGSPLPFQSPVLIHLYAARIEMTFFGGHTTCYEGGVLFVIMGYVSLPLSYVVHVIYIGKGNNPVEMHSCLEDSLDHIALSFDRSFVLASDATKILLLI